MGIKVAKFGGSSVADAIQIGKTKKIIEADSCFRLSATAIRLRK